MKKKSLILVICIIIGISVLGAYLYQTYFISHNKPMEQIWRFNLEKNRDAATMLLDCALLVKMTDPLKFSMLGHISETTIFDLRHLSDLYAEGGNAQRSQWMNSFVKKLEKDSIKESYEPFYASKSEHEKAWEDIEKLISEGNITAAVEKNKDNPFVSAKLGQYYAKQNKKEEALQYFQMALRQLNSETSRNIRYDTLKSTIFGYIELNENQMAIRLYREYKKDLMNLPIQMINAFVDNEDYDSAFNMLHDDSWSLYEALAAIAKGHIKQQRQSLKNDHKEIITNIIMQHKGAIKKVSALSQTEPGSDAYRSFQKKFIDAINKADKKK